MLVTQRSERPSQKDRGSEETQIAPDSFVCSLVSSLAGRQDPLQRWDQPERLGLVPSLGTMELPLNKHTLAQTHKAGGGGEAEGGREEPLFHADLLSVSNVWYAGILALLADLISAGLPEPPARVCVFVCMCVIICLRARPLDKTPGLSQADRHRRSLIQPIRRQEAHTQTHTYTHTK